VTLPDTLPCVLRGGSGTDGQEQFLTRMLTSYQAILDLATSLLLKKLLYSCDHLADQEETTGGSHAHRDHHCCGLCAVGSMSWSGKAPCQLEHLVYDHSDRRVCRHLVCRRRSEHVDWCVASGVSVSSSATGFPGALLVAIRGANLCTVEVPLSASTCCMGKNRLEAFSDGVLAILITIMVLEMKVPHGEGIETLVPVIPVFLSYVLSFVYLDIYWNNHHHMLHATHTVTGPMLWANLH